MTVISQVKELMEVIGADGVHVGTVDRLENNRMTKADSGEGTDGLHNDDSPHREMLVIDKRLSSRRLLVVEDEMLVLMNFEDMLGDLR